MDIEALLKNFSDSMAKERSETQMTLGEMIGFLKGIHPSTVIDGISAECGSYRGYYSDLAFEPGDSTAGELLEVAEDALGKTFEGYKGGDYTMTKITPLWCSEYGTVGLKIVEIDEQDNGCHLVITEEDEY